MAGCRSKKLIDFRELATAIGRRLHLEEHDGALRLQVESEGAPALVRPLPVALHVPGRQLPAYVSVLLDGTPLSLPVHLAGEDFGYVILPCSAASAL